MKTLTAILAASIAGSLSASAFAAPNADVYRPRVMLKCQIVDYKVVQIFNSTGAAIAQGTKITYDAIRDGNGEHFGETLASPYMAPGTWVKRGASHSTSCTAWFVRPLVRAP